MLLMGDEMRRTQRGNNNAHCLDDETTWLDWGVLDRHDDVRRFVRLLIRHRLQRDSSQPAGNFCGCCGSFIGPSSGVAAGMLVWPCPVARRR